MPDPSVFISYRRSDTGGHAGRLFDALRRRLGRDHVFMDVDSIAAGEDWMTSIDSSIARSDVLLALIGSDWLAGDASGVRRIDNERDPLRHELETALTTDKPIIPVLVGGAVMPNADELPESLRPLRRRNALRVNHETFEADLRSLVGSIRKLSKPDDGGNIAERGPRGTATGSLTLTFLFSDLVGSTALIQRVGEEKAQVLFKRHHEQLLKAVRDHDGTELEWLGDGIVSSFPSAAEAIRCALAMQERTRAPVDGETLSMRIGVHTGEAMRREGGYFGNSVVIARRLCERAAGGQILTSGFVASMLRGRSLDFRSLGAFELKGIAQPIEGFEVRESGAGYQPVPAAPVAAAATDSATLTPARTGRRPMALVVGAAVGVVVIVGGLLVALGLLDSGKPTGNAPVIAGGTNIIEFPVAANCPTRSCFIHLLDAVDDPDGDPLTIVSVGPSEAGATVSVGSDGGIASAIWRPPAGFTGSTDSFSFTVSDNHHNLVQGTCHVVDIPPP